MPLAPLATALVLALPAPAAAPSHTLVQLRADAVCREAAGLLAAGATSVAPELRLYRLPATTARLLAPGLRARGAVARVAPDRPAGMLAATQFADPLSADEWWRAAIGAEGLVPPGPGRPVTVVDSGIDVTHPEFAGRPGLTTLNPQEPAGIGGEHGTAVSSLVGAPENGAGFVGIYPQAELRVWDAARGAGTQLSTSEIVSGILEAARTAQGVINLSLGGPDRDPLIEQAVGVAFAAGSLVVAASGNDGQEGSPLGYPAALPHVLTVAATNRDNAVASFSSSSRYVDLAAPGQDVVVATALGRGWQPASGTSFAAPLVAGAAAWVWTVRPELDHTQLFEVMRRSARDIGAPGRDADSGFGLLDVAAALTAPAPVRDPLEPNEDLEYLKPQGYFATSVGPLTTPARPSAALNARLDVWEDPRDVYRLWQPAGKKLRATVTAPVDVDLSAWSHEATSVLQRPGKLRFAVSAHRGSGNERVDVTSTKRGRFVYVAVTLGRGVVDGDYRLSVR